MMTGPKVIDRAIRPPRIAFIVGSIQDCKEIIDSCCMSWGGKYFLIVPCDQDHKVTETWMKIIYKYDPDSIYSTVDLEEVTENLLNDLISPKYEFSKENKGSIPIIDRSTQNSICTYGLSVLKVLTGLGVLEKKEYSKRCLLPIIDENDPLELYVKARYGSINQNAILSILAKDGFNNFNQKLDDFIHIDKPSVNDSNYIDFALGQETSIFHSRNCIPLIDLTLIGLTQQVRGREIGQSGNPEILFDAPNLLFVSTDQSIEDFCWYWDLRSQRYLSPYIYKLPLWLPLSTVRDNIDKIRTVMSFGQRPGYIISTSVPDDELNDLAQLLGPSTYSYKSNLDRFYANEFFVEIKDKIEVYFNKNKSIVPIPNTEPTKYCNTSNNYYLVDINIPNIVLPRINNTSWDKWNFIRYRVTRTGLSYSAPSAVTDNLLEVIIPSPWEILETITGLAGYEVDISDKGRLAEKLLNLIGGINQAWIFSGHTIYKLLDELSELSQSKEFKQRLKSLGLQNDEIDNLMTQIADDRHERVQKDLGDIKRILAFKNQDTASNLIYWMLKNHLLLRGVEVICPNCRTKQWIVIHDIDEEMFCNGCQQRVDTNIKIDSTTWQYRINTLLAKVFEQGVIPHILTVRNAIDESREIIEPKIITVFYGIQISAKENFELPIKNKEIDVAWINSGKLTIGECKTNGKELSLEEVKSYIKIAETIKAAEIIFSVLDDMDSIDKSVRDEIEQSPIPTQIITKNDLFDQFPHRATNQDVNKGLLLKSTYEDYIYALSTYLEWKINSHH